jgi:hypothetical protein
MNVQNYDNSRLLRLCSAVTMHREIHRTYYTPLFRILPCCMNMVSIILSDRISALYFLICWYYKYSIQSFRIGLEYPTISDARPSPGI